MTALSIGERYLWMAAHTTRYAQKKTTEEEEPGKEPRTPSFLH